jgi:predicted phage terminase large subunit-like protein
MRATGLPVVEYTPSRGTKSAPNDKIARLNSISDVFSSGKVWTPETRWADEVRDQIAAFPNSDHDDLTDSSVQAIMRFRQGGFIRLNSDEREEPRNFRRKASYY